MLFEGTDDLDLSALPAASDASALPGALHAGDARELQRLLPGARRPLCCYVSEDAGRGCMAAAKALTLHGPFPKGSFFDDARGFMVPAPELLALLLGREMPPGRLLMIAAELAGFYVPMESGLIAAPPLMTTDSIAEYLESLRSYRRAAGCRMPRGFASAASLCSLPLGRAASPAEAALAYLLCLPRKMGGYGLPRPELNRRIVVDGAPYVCDLSWNGGSCLLEYQGGIHGQEARSATDMRKGNVLRGSGRTLLEAGSRDLMSITGMDRLAGLLANALGCSLATWSPEERAIQVELRAEVLSALKV